MSQFKSMFEYMGVVNATPDSFSDGGEYQNTTIFKARLKTWRDLGARFIDVGGESTAPMNQAVGHDEEWQRIESVLPLITDIPLSLDSYRSKTVLKLLEKRELALWNDISGKLDSELEAVFKKYPNLQTVYCHNLAPSRDLSSNHMDYVSEENIFTQLESAFSKALFWYKERGLKAPYLDFCFGFSKTYEQNWQILKELPQFISSFEAKHGQQQWILAISRKSFLKRNAIDGVDHNIRSQTEYMQSFYLAWLWQNLAPTTKMLVRLHDPELAHAVSSVGEKL